MIRELSAPCWVLVGANGKPFGNPEWRPHFDTKADAARRIADYELEATPQVGDKPCWNGVCDGCGDQPDWEEGGDMHFGSLADAQTAFKAYDYDVVGQDVRCEDCKPEPEPEPDELPGQLDLTEATR